MNRVILDYVDAIRQAVEDHLCEQYRDFNVFDVVELVQDNFTLYGQLVLLDSLKKRKFIFNYKRKADNYFLAMQ